MYYIYKITNKINGKTYIGQHKYRVLNDLYMGSGILIKKAIIKYGIENFEKEILYSNIQYKETADSMEIFAIAKEKALGKAEYNIADGGQGGNLGEAVNKKISEKAKGNKHTLGRKRTTEECERISKANKGHSVTAETKKKISEALHTEEVQKKLSAAHKGKPSHNKGKHCKLVNGKRVYV